jgi:hypothetical protein
VTESAREWIVVAALAAVVTLDVGTLGSDPWRFRAGDVHPHGLLGPLVRAADRGWDLGLLRSLAMLAGVLVVALAVWAAFRRVPWKAELAAAVVVCAALLLPAVALQVGLRQATAPWFFTNDSTYQLELAGKLVRDGDDPYGADYAHSGLERFYSLNGSPSEPESHAALSHFAYFPGAALMAAAWGVLPSPFDDVRWLVVAASFALLPAALLFPGPRREKLALGVLLAANPIVVRAAWFGTADAPTLLLLVLAFALALRRRAGWAGIALGAAILTKQFAVAAVPFLAVTLLLDAGREALRRAAIAAGAVLVAGFLPFLVADPGALWRDTVSYGAGTYRIVGYGLSAILLNLHVLEDRNGAYPFFPLVLLVWVPVTAALVWAQWRARSLWLGAAGLATSIFLLTFLGRVFQISYLVYPFTFVVLAALVALAERTQSAVAASRPQKIASSSSAL